MDAMSSLAFCAQRSAAGSHALAPPLVAGPAVHSLPTTVSACSMHDKSNTALGSATAFATVFGFVLGLSGRSKVQRRRVAAAATDDFDGPPVKIVCGEQAFRYGDKCKTIHFVRHSEAVVNVEGRQFPKDDPRRKAVRLDEKHFDSPLSENGLKDATLFADGDLEGAGFPPFCDLVAASPLTRALQTATAVFEGDKENGTKVVALEALREFCGKDFQPCDSRRDPSELKTQFPHVNLDNISAGGDTLLAPDKVESEESADKRIQWLFRWLRDQDVKSIACVGHFQILNRIFKNHLVPAGLDPTRYNWDKPFKNLEVRSVPMAIDAGDVARTQKDAGSELF
eukprot:TRINITY_DN100968_c0_g1_i1.p1 TRINITY_DN100968_c0_g1~~TRINITY_DN100968_c0_g1_i1.p1  ORF type:complete len:340 (+),score=75.01 TRINITY_DN100968_c0_g1_i1:46-1065(+)